MIRERLTLAQCAPGVKIKCVEADYGLVGGVEYIIERVLDEHGVYLAGIPSRWWSCRRFVFLAPAPAAPVVLTDAMRSALVAWYAAYTEGDYECAIAERFALLIAIEATPNLLPDPAPPPPGTTDAGYDAWWFA